MVGGPLQETKAPLNYSIMYNKSWTLSHKGLAWMLAHPLTATKLLNNPEPDFFICEMGVITHAFLSGLLGRLNETVKMKVNSPTSAESRHLPT